MQNFTAPPDLNGEWTGNIDSSYDNGDDFEGDDSSEPNEPEPDSGPKMNIDQTWSRINVTIDFGTSRSASNTASFLKEYSDSLLRITYQNKPKNLNGESLSIHEGTNDLILDESGGTRTLSGDYYTDEERNNHGVVKFSQPNKASSAMSMLRQFLS